MSTMSSGLARQRWCIVEFPNRSWPFTSLKCCFALLSSGQVSRTGSNWTSLSPYTATRERAGGAGRLTNSISTAPEKLSAANTVKGTRYVPVVSNM